MAHAKQIRILSVEDHPLDEVATHLAILTELANLLEEWMGIRVKKRLIARDVSFCSAWHSHLKFASDLSNIFCRPGV